MVVFIAEDNAGGKISALLGDAASGPASTPRQKKTRDQPRPYFL
jgi:hypothetical protein